MLLRGLIGAVLRRIRIAQSRTLRDVAEAARVSVPYLSEVERGRKEPSSELLAAICAALDLELTDLLAEVRFEIARSELTPLPLGGRPRRDPVARVVTSTTSLHPGRLSSGLLDAVPGPHALTVPAEWFAAADPTLPTGGRVVAA